MNTYDFALTWVNRPEEPFVQRLKKECNARRMKMLVCGPENIRSVVKEVEAKQSAIKFLLDNEASYNDPIDLYARLCYAVKDTEGCVVCDPDRAKSASDKSIVHYDLLKAGIAAPYTVVVRNWQPDNFELSAEQRKRLGEEFIIKPATGFGQRGVVKNTKGSIAEIASARDFNRGDNFLLQEKVEPVMLDGRPAWFRIYYLFGELIPCWWSTETGHYNRVTFKQAIVYNILPLVKIVSEIARLTGLEFFSSEIAITKPAKKGRRLVVVDYVNDQPELCVRPPAMGGPLADVTEYIAEKCVDAAWRIINGSPLRNNHRSVTMFEEENC